jgi:hypothetical protein
MRYRSVLLAVLLFVAGVCAARPLPQEDIPIPLKPWTGWVLHGHENQSCQTYRATRTSGTALGRRVSNKVGVPLFCYLRQ